MGKTQREYTKDAEGRQVATDVKKIDYTYIWRSIVIGMERQRKAAIEELQRTEIKPENIAQFFFDHCDHDWRMGRTFEQRFSACVGAFSVQWPEFKAWWNLMNRDERLRFRLRHNLGGSVNPHRVAAAMAVR